MTPEQQVAAAALEYIRAGDVLRLAAEHRRATDADLERLKTAEKWLTAAQHLAGRTAPRQRRRP